MRNSEFQSERRMAEMEDRVVYSIAVEFEDATDVLPMGPFSDPLEALGKRDEVAEFYRNSEDRSAVRVFVVVGERVLV